jgi:hypothetical protein
MDIRFESDFRAKLLLVSFAKAYKINSQQDIDCIKDKWFEELKRWHSPYKALVDCSKLAVADSKLVHLGLEKLIKMLKSLFLIKIAGYGHKPDSGHDHLGFVVHAEQQAALKELAIRSLQRVDKKDGDFRSLIRFENYFPTNLVEISFATKVDFTTKGQVEILKSKMLNNLLLWHDKWNLLVDCSNLEIKQDLFNDFERLFKQMRGFFMLQAVGFTSHHKGASYPMKVFRSRHLALNFFKKNPVVSQESEVNCVNKAVAKKS